MRPQNSVIRSALKKCKRAFIFAFIFSFVISIFTLAMPIYSMQVLDRVLSSNSVETLIFLSLIILLFLIFLAILTAIRAAVLQHIANWLDKKISPLLFDFSVENQGNKNINSQNLRDLQIIKSFISGPNLPIILDAPFAIVFLIFIFFIHPINGIITIVGGLILLKMALINEKMTKSLIEKTNEIQIELTRDFEIISSNSDVVRAMGMKENVKKNWQNSNIKFRDFSNKLNSRTNVISSTTKSMRLVIQVVTMAASAALVMFNKMSSGGIIATSILAGKALAPFDAAISLWKSITTVKKSYFRLNESLKNIDAKQHKIELPQLRGEIIAEKLIYKLANSDKIPIKSISFKIEAGQLIALIGPSASGKTSLAKLLTGIINPSSGFIRIDNADLSDQDFEKIGKFIGYLPQNIELFKGSIKENIARMDKNAKDEDIIAASEFCAIHQMILKLPQGYETMIDNASPLLSSGQKQRLALARAYFGAAKFVVLDEPNSNLDQEGEAALIKTLQMARQKKITTIIITHKPSIAAICDKIMILNDGQIATFDDAQKIISKNVSAG